MKRTQRVYEQIEFAIYIVCILLTCAICILLYADGVIRDEYNVFINGIKLRQNLLILIGFNIIFIVSKCLFHNKFVKVFIIIIFIPLFFTTSVTIGSNILSIRNIIQENKFSQTGFNSIHINDLNDILTKKKTATIYIGRDDCPVCEEIYPKLEMYLYQNQISILSYSTSEDRDNNFERMTAVLDKFKVDAVPAVLIIENGIVIESYFGEDIENYIKAYDPQ